MRKLLKKLPKNSWPAILLIVIVLVFILFINAINFSLKASSWGEAVGSHMGTLVGKAVGSFDGLTKGRKDGTEAGKEAGLSAEDTEAKIANEIRQLEKLEVLAASVKLKNIHMIGDPEDQEYAALYLINGSVVFTVDLGEADISSREDGLHIGLPRPEGKLYIDDSSIEKAAEYQKRFWTGSAEEGFDAYINSMKKVQEATEETLSNYHELQTSAKTAAEKQVTLLARSVSAAERNVIVEWIE